MFFSTYRLPPEVNAYLVRFIAVASCLYAILDIRSDLFVTHISTEAGVVNDAAALSQLTGLPAILSAVLWMAVSLILLAYFLKSSLRAR
jgi:hypothetical protein